ncbi:carboxypeptidase-like regulatory domain-containing protein [bacterium]|nr:carboxypeptidase-like regulatory domain-containing protein [bacterium]
MIIPHSTGTVISEESAGILSGTVTDDTTKHILPGATITVPVGLDILTAITDRAGCFVIEHIPEGINFPVTVSHPDYKNLTLTVSIKAGKKSRIEAGLSSVYLHLEYPNGGEAIFAGSKIHIRWTSVGIKKVRLEFSTNNGRNWRLIEAEADGPAGSYIWDVPDIPSKEYLIRITDSGRPDMHDVSDGVFSNSST